MYGTEAGYSNLSVQLKSSLACLAQTTMKVIEKKEQHFPSIYIRVVYAQRSREY